MQIFSTLSRFAESGVGDVKALHGRADLRLRAGDYRIFFARTGRDAIEIRRVRHRKDAYR
jgi:mRNA interferase RelE/StbE